MGESETNMTRTKWLPLTSVTFLRECQSHSSSRFSSYHHEGDVLANSTTEVDGGDKSVTYHYATAEGFVSLRKTVVINQRGKQSKKVTTFTHIIPQWVEIVTA